MYIEKLTGTYDRLLTSGIIIDVAGVGYGLEMPLSSLCELPAVGSRLSVWTFTHVREDAIRLFGFLRYEDRAAFEIMLSLSGVGPKVALAILSTLSLSAIRRAIQYNDPQILVSVPGVGPRSAEKILVELKPKLEKLSAPMGLEMDANPDRLGDSDFDSVLDDGRLSSLEAKKQILNDVSSALENLGFKDKAISPIIDQLRTSSEDESFQVVMKKALKLLSDGSKETKAKKSSKKSSGSIRRDQELF